MTNWKIYWRIQEKKIIKKSKEFHGFYHVKKRAEEYAYKNLLKVLQPKKKTIWEVGGVSEISGRYVADIKHFFVVMLDSKGGIS